MENSKAIATLAVEMQISRNKFLVLSSLEAYTGDSERQQRRDEPRWPPHGTCVESGCSSSWNRPCRPFENGSSAITRHTRGAPKRCIGDDI